jgi:UDP-glucose 4-epimerase
VRVVVFGATGNVGTSTVRALQRIPKVDSVLGIARRVPDSGGLGIEWQEADITSDHLVPLVRGADAVIHLAWVLHPVRDEPRMQAVNVVGSERIFEAVEKAGVRSLVYASSVGAYSPAIDDMPVDESYATNGIATSTYSRQKAYVERVLDSFEARHSGIRVVRLRPGLVFQREAAEEIRRLFLGRRIPARLVGHSRLPVIPSVPGLVFQAVHADDVGHAYALAATREVVGAFNVAADPVLTPSALAEALHARTIPVPAGLVRFAARASFGLRLQRSDPGWLDLAMKSPILDTTRARTVLEWEPRRSSSEALVELLDGMGAQEKGATPQLTRPVDGD